MRYFSILLLALSSGVACSSVSMEMGNGGTPVPSSPPNQALFAPVQTALEQQTCGTAACHLAPGQPSGVDALILVTIAPNGGDITNNARRISCGGRLNSYDPPDGIIRQYFCDAAGAPLPTAEQHQLKNFTAADCTALFAWLSSGEGQVPQCP